MRSRLQPDKACCCRANGFISFATLRKVYLFSILVNLVWSHFIKMGVNISILYAITPIHLTL